MQPIKNKRRRNYWETHKNKQPKRVLKKKPTDFQKHKAKKIAKTVLIGAIGAAQLHHTPFGLTKEQSRAYVLNNLLNTAKGIIKNNEFDALDNFRTLGFYGRKPKSFTSIESNKDIKDIIEQTKRELSSLTIHDIIKKD